MKIKVSSEEKIIITRYLNDFIGLKKYEDALANNFSNLVIQNKDGSYLEIINDYYIDENEYNIFRQSIRDYILNNFKKLLLINDNLNCKYQVKTNVKDTSKDNYVKNGSLVLKVNRVVDYSGDLSEKIINLNSLKTYLETIEIDLSSKIQVPVKIICFDEKITN